MLIRIAGTGLDSPKVRPTDSHLPVLAAKSAGGDADNTKTDIVVTVVAIVVVVAVRRAAVFRIVDPGAAPQSGSPHPSSIPCKNKGTKYLLSQLPGITV